MKLIKFAIVGVIGFIVDAAIFTLFLHGLGWGTMTARLIAFFFAASSTWLGNRRLTFSDASVNDSKSRQWSKSMASACLSALPNFIAFKASLMLLGEEGIFAYVALVIGILVGMVSNYLLNARWVFKATSER